MKNKEHNEKEKELFEAIHAVVIDTVYLQYKDGFCDYENHTHKLGFFKEEVKRKFHEALNK